MTDKERALIQIGQVMKARQFSLVLAVIAALMIIFMGGIFNGVVSIFCVISWWLQGKMLESFAARHGVNLDEI